MGLKAPLSIVVVLLAHQARAGLISLDEREEHPELRDHHHQHHHQHHHSVATSYMHFHGPVEGPAFEVKVPYVDPHPHQRHNELEEGQEHELEHGYVHDYVAHPKYHFAYGVEDHHTGDFHSQKESRDGCSVTGEYSVKEPGGNVRVVSYHAGKDGFHAHVHTTGKTDHSSGSYGYYLGHNHQYHQHRPQHVAAAAAATPIVEIQPGHGEDELGEDEQQRHHNYHQHQETGQEQLLRAYAAQQEGNYK